MIDPPSVDQLPDVLTHAEHLPTLPTVAVELTRLSQDENASVEDLAAVISLDPALVAKILKLANSAAFRRGFEVTSIERAALKLGMKAMQFLALSFSLMDSLPRRGSSGSFDYLSYWQYSVTMAVAGRELARLVKSPYQQEVFLCSLLGRFGQLVMAQAIPDLYATVYTQTAGVLPTAELEHTILGFDHHQVGAFLLRTWKFPRVLTETIGAWEAAHTLPSEMDEATQALGHLVQMADITSQVIWADRKEVALLRLHEYGSQHLGVASVEIDACFLSLEEKLAETASLFEIEMMGLCDFQSILNEARDRLVQLSLGTIHDLEQTKERVEDLERENQQLANLAETDRLTSLRNRASFDTCLQLAIEARLQGDSEAPLGILIMDIDHFKMFNDTYGHLLGDEMLKQVAEGIEVAARQTDIVARYGGEEFVVLLPHTTIDILEQIAERIRSCVSSGKVVFQGQELTVTMSVGGAYVQRIENPEDGMALLKLADECLYEAKGAGRNRAVCREMARLVVR